MNQGNISVLKGHAPRNGHRKVTKPDGKAVDGAAERILGRQKGPANGKPAVPAAMEKHPDESWGLAQLAAFITAVSRDRGRGVVDRPGSVDRPRPPQGGGGLAPVAQGRSRRTRPVDRVPVHGDL